MNLSIKSIIIFGFIFIITGCTSIHRGSLSSRSSLLSQGLQQAYAVSPAKADRLSPIILRSADQHDVPPELIAATIRQESNFNSAARSPSGAVGLAQIIPSYWRNDCPGDLFDEATNIQCSAHILATYHRDAGSWFKASAYYNVGPTGYKSSFWTRHKAKKYARSVRKFEKQLKKNL